MTLEQGFEILNRTIQFDLKHEFYDQTIAIKTFCHQVMTGKNQAEFLMNWRDKETERQQKTRLKLYNSLTTYALNPVMNLCKRVNRVDPSLNVVEHEDEDKEQRIKKALNTYHSGGSVKRYLDSRLLFFNFYDPNTFILTERIDERGAENQIVNINPYPFEVSSEQAINYEYQNGSPIWLIVEHKRKEVVYDIKDGKPDQKEEDVSDFYFYAAGIQIVYREFVNEVPEGETIELESINASNPRKFVVEQYDTGSTEFPGRKAGAYFHAEYENVRVPFYWAAEDVLKDLIYHKCTLDVSINKHIYPKEKAYLPRCEWRDTNGNECIQGYINGDHNHACPSCSGSGKAIHYSEQDLIEYKLPQDYADWKDLPELSKLTHYDVIPIEVTRYLGELVDKSPQRVQYAIFNTSIEEKPVVAATATEEMHNWESVNVVASDYARCYSEMYECIYRVTAQYYEYQDGFKVDHEFPKDLKLEPISVLIARLKSAKESGMNYDSIWAIEQDINHKLFANSIEKILEIQVKEELKPFRGKSREDVAMILQQRANDDPMRVLEENFALVIDTAEELAGMPLYQVAPDKRQGFVDQAIENVLESIKYAVDLSAMPMGMTEQPLVDEEGNPIDPTADGLGVPQSQLNGAQIAALTGLIQNVALGDLPRDSAIAIMQSGFGFTREVATAVLGSSGGDFKSAKQIQSEQPTPSEV